MKTRNYFLLAAFFVSGLAFTQAQRTTTVVSYSDNYRDDYRDDYDYDRDTYEVSRRYLDMMSSRDRERYYDLVDRLDRVESEAWENGSLSNRERDRIDNILEELDDLVYKYERRYYNRYHDRRPYRPVYRSSGPAVYIAAALLGRNRYRGVRRSYRPNNYRRVNNRNRRSSRNRTRCW